jgi:hypothetical protein
MSKYSSQHPVLKHPQSVRNQVLCINMTVLWVLAPCSLGDCPDYGGSKDLWNIGKLLPDYTAQKPIFIITAMRTWNLTRFMYFNLYVLWWYIPVSTCRINFRGNILHFKLIVNVCTEVTRHNKRRKLCGTVCCCRRTDCSDRVCGIVRIQANVQVFVVVR